MDTNYKPITQSQLISLAKEWANTDKKNRSVMLLTTEVCDNGKNLSIGSCTESNNAEEVVKGLIAAMQKHKSFANIICHAVIAYAEMHSNDPDPSVN